MKTCYIVCALDCKVDISLENDDLLIGADRGYFTLVKNGFEPNVAIGDFDSYTGEIDCEKTIKFPVKKDYTDSALAIEYAIQNGYDKIVVYGGIGGALDHTMANLSLLEKLWGTGIRAIITDGKNRARYIERTSELVPNVGFKYLSLICADREAKGVSLDGCKYPLKNAKLTRSGNSFTTSNEILKNCALVSVKKGGLYIIESKD